MAGTRLRSDERGMGAVEFALIAPVFFALLIGITQLGMLYFANADLKNAVAAGARHATIFPRPTPDAIRTSFSQKIVKLDRSRVTGLDIAFGRDSNGWDFYELEAKYAVPLNFVFFTTPPVTLTEKRKVFLQPAA